MSTPPDRDHWLVRPATIRGLWVLLAVILTAIVAVQLAFPEKGKFGIDGWFGFAAGFGFLACVAMVVFAKALGVFLKRKDTYYDE